jgi:hypothetical protein
VNNGVLRQQQEINRDAHKTVEPAEEFSGGLF